MAKSGPELWDFSVVLLHMCFTLNERLGKLIIDEEEKKRKEKKKKIRLTKKWDFFNPPEKKKQSNQSKALLLKWFNLQKKLRFYHPASKALKTE